MARVMLGLATLGLALAGALAAQPVRVGRFAQSVRVDNVAAAVTPPVTGVPGWQVRQSANGPEGRLAIAAGEGLFERMPNEPWVRLLPRAGARSWAPVDVRGVAYDAQGRLWFASPQGVGVRDGGAWRLYTAEDGLPYDDFTTVAAGGGEAAWFGTRIGAIRFDGSQWEYRQGRRWLPDDEVRAIAVEESGSATITTATGAVRIERRPMTLRAKAGFFEDEIDRRHRRTQYGYVLGVSLKRPGDTSEWTQHDSDNDGLWTAMYGAGECFAFAARGDAGSRQRARQAFEALRFLRVMAENGTPAPPKGFVARTVLPASAGNPNGTAYSPERDRKTRETRDRLWKIMSPRWPLSADGQWYWKADTSSDELDGHYFFYGLYYDLVADAGERERVREHVRAITDHLIDHGFQLRDHDGAATRWGIFDPASLNGSANWWADRGLNSLSILTYLKVAGHITGEARYEKAARELITRHHYDQNVLIPKTSAGPGGGNQSDDEMFLMNFYHLVRYERDAGLKSKYARALRTHWENERPERNPLFGFIAKAALEGLTFETAFRTETLTVPSGDLADGIDTLKRYPLDRVNWGHRNSHRRDIALLHAGARESGARGGLRDGRAIPIDERFVEHWNHDPWRLDVNGAGTTLADGASFLLPYYMGLYHRYLEDDPPGAVP
ncbi:MAG: hypothetical protein FJW40_09975 [Acidobacteria bacterium]|nr:hypothetical protein [Acidobacteriota bacterium]